MRVLVTGAFGNVGALTVELLETRGYQIRAFDVPTPANLACADRFGPRVKAWVDLVGTLGLLVPFCLFALVMSQDFVADSVRIREVSNDPGGLVRWPLKVAVPVAFGLLLLQALSEVVKRLAFLRGLGLFSREVSTFDALEARKAFTAPLLMGSKALRCHSKKRTNTLRRSRLLGNQAIS